MRFSRVMVKFHGISSCFSSVIYVDKSSRKEIDLKACCNDIPLSKFIYCIKHELIVLNKIFIIYVSLE